MNRDLARVDALVYTRMLIRTGVSFIKKKREFNRYTGLYLYLKSDSNLSCVGDNGIILPECQMLS